MDEQPQNWKAWCQEQLGISDDTAHRYIQIFESARNRALARKNAAKRGERDDFELWERVCVLMDSPSAELTGSELDELAVHVHELVDHDTQAGLLEELGIKSSPKKLTGGDTSEFRKENKWAALEEQAITLFSAVTRQFGEAEKQIFSVRTHANYQFLLEELPITSDHDGKPRSPESQDDNELLARNMETLAIGAGLSPHKASLVKLVMRAVERQKLKIVMDKAFKKQRYE